MIITSDCDQFNTVITFGKYNLLKNSMVIREYYFMPRELFNMVQLQIIYALPYDIKNRKILNAVPTQLRRNLRNIKHPVILIR